MDETLNRLYACAHAWQTRRNERTLIECVDKVKEECAEFGEAITHADQLDEMGDILVCALRAIQQMTPQEREFVCLLMESKVRRRVDRGVKDKDSEARYRAVLAEEWNIEC